MSFYAYGKLVTPTPSEVRKFLREVEEETGVALTESALDEGDVEELDSVPELRGLGLFFSASDEPGSADATGLWDEAMEAMRAADVEEALGSGDVTIPNTVAFTRTRLGTLCRRLLQTPLASACGLALVDGGIDEVFVGSADDCLQAITAESIRPWHATSNRLYVVRRMDSQ
jgi:hypothetical protein